MSIKRAGWGLVAAGLALLAPAPRARADFDLPLWIREWHGAGGAKNISNGIPLLPGQARETDELHVIGPDGKELPAQFRVLARWWNRDNSIRWVLTDFPLSVEDCSETTVTLAGRTARAVAAVLDGG